MNRLELMVTDMSTMLMVRVTGTIPSAVVERRGQAGDVAGNLQLIADLGKTDGDDAEESWEGALGCFSN